MTIWNGLLKRKQSDRFSRSQVAGPKTVTDKRWPAKRSSEKSRPVQLLAEIKFAGGERVFRSERLLA